MTNPSRDKFDLDFSSIHKAIFPTDVRESDRIVARIRRRGDQEPFTSIRVWKLSPLGIELVFDASNPFERGDKVDLEITLAGQRSLFEGLVVDLIQTNDSIKLIGIRLSNKRPTSAPNGEKRRSTRWICSDEYYPTCVAPTPGRYNEYIYFQIRDISREGFQLHCSLRNKYLIPGTQLNLTASFPMVGDLSLTVSVKRIGITSDHGKDYLVVGTEFRNLTDSAKNIIGQYLLQFTDAESLSELRSAGFVPLSIDKGTDFYFLKSEDDYDQVLNLRLLAHSGGGTIDSNLEPVDMGDVFDTNSRIVVGKYKGEVIASARVHFNVLEEPMEHEQYLDWPADQPRRDQIFEISRACTHPNFRSNDLMAALLRFIATCIQPQRPWALISSTEELKDFYLKVGFRDTGLRYTHSVFQGTQCVLLVNTPEMFLGRTSHPIYWNVIWRAVYNHLVESGTLLPDPMDRARIRVYKILYPIAQLWFRLTTRINRTS
jgi:predicted GNAT family N-acyltransferase